MEGTLSKWTNVMQGWRYRYFVLDDNAGLFSYYTSRFVNQLGYASTQLSNCYYTESVLLINSCVLLVREKMVRGSRRGCVRLKGAQVGIDDEVCSHTSSKLIYLRSTWTSWHRLTWPPLRPQPACILFQNNCFICADGYLDSELRCLAKKEH